MDMYEINRRNHPREHAIAKLEYAHAHGIAGGGVIPLTPEYKNWMIHRVSELLVGEVAVREFTRVGNFTQVGAAVAPPPPKVPVHVQAPAAAPEPDPKPPAPKPAKPKNWRGLALVAAVGGIVILYALISPTCANETADPAITPTPVVETETE